MTEVTRSTEESLKNMALLGYVLLAASFLVGVSARDPSVYAGVTLLLILVATAANYLPASRAAALEPARVLREN